MLLVVRPEIVLRERDAAGLVIIVREEAIAEITETEATVIIRADRDRKEESAVISQSRMLRHLTQVLRIRTPVPEISDPSLERWK